MDIRYSCNQRDFKRYTTEETRKEFLIETLFVDDTVQALNEQEADPNFRGSGHGAPEPPKGEDYNDKYLQG